MPKVYLGTACALLAMAVSSSGFAAGRGQGAAPPAHGINLYHPVANGHVGLRPRSALPPLAGIIHERAGRSPTITRFGQSGTAAALPGYATAGGSRFREAYRRFPERYGRDYRSYPPFEYGRRRYDYASTGLIGYGDTSVPTAITAPENGGYALPSQSYSYAEPPLDARYAEPSLAQTYDGAANLPPFSAAPQIIIVNNGAPPPRRTCICQTTSAEPVVYRYGVAEP